VIPSPRAVEEFTAGERAFDLTKDKEGRHVAWAGTSSVYFDAFVLFGQPAEIAKVAAEMRDFETEKLPERRPVLMTFETTAQPLAKDETRTLQMTAFFGPRWRQVLSADYYAADGVRDYDQTLVVKSGPCGFCAFDWLILSLVWLLNSFQWLAGGFAGAGDWGIAIILLVALVRTCLHPITKRSQMQMMKMGKMGPELAKLKEKYGDDKEAFTRAQMQVMKDQGHRPAARLPADVPQMPIWIALWQALQSTFELRQAPFLWGYTWIRDLSKPDYLIKFDWDHPPTLFMVTLDGLNLLPILMSVVFFVQITIQNRLQPKGTPEQEAQKKMMVWMSTLLFPLFLYNGPSGLNLYILTSTMVGIIESKVIRDHIKQREAAEKAQGPVVVDARPTRAGPAEPGRQGGGGAGEAGRAARVHAAVAGAGGGRPRRAGPPAGRQRREGEVRRWWVGGRRSEVGSCRPGNSGRRPGTPPGLPEPEGAGRGIARGASPGNRPRKHLSPEGATERASIDVPHCRPSGLNLFRSRHPGLAPRAMVLPPLRGSDESWRYRVGRRYTPPPCHPRPANPRPICPRPTPPRPPNPRPSTPTSAGGRPAAGAGRRPLPARVDGRRRQRLAADPRRRRLGPVRPAVLRRPIGHVRRPPRPGVGRRRRDRRRPTARRRRPRPRPAGPPRPRRPGVAPLGARRVPRAPRVGAREGGCWSGCRRWPRGRRTGSCGRTSTWTGTTPRRPRA
jgi:YidC/Oxa1 family membrane protein insertase